MITLSENFLTVDGHFGDHMLPGSEPGTEEFISTETPRSLIWTGYFFRAAFVTAEVAHVLGNDDDERRYKRLAENIKNAFNEEWFDERKAVYATGSQTSYFFPLALGIVPEHSKKQLIENIVDDINRKYDGHMHTGNTGTTCMIDTLVDNGYGEVLFDIVTKDSYPGWGYMIAKGATTIWENWGGHPTTWAAGKQGGGQKTGGGAESMIMWATIDEFFYNDLAGIKGPKYYSSISDEPGYRNIVIDPFIAEDLEYAGGEIVTVRGPIFSRWRKTSDGLLFDVSIPPNTNATVCVPTPDIETREIFESGISIWKDGMFVPGAEGFHGAEIAEDRKSIKFSVGSGYYRFSVGPNDLSLNE